MVIDEEDIFLGATTTVSLTKDNPLVETNTTVTRRNDIFSSALAGSGDQEFVKNVVGIFVQNCANTTELDSTCIELDLRGVEFQAMPSGLHTISQDVIYFSRNHYNGIAAFKNLPLFDQSIDRGARMASVGIVVSATSDTGPCGQPWRHLEFLKSEVG
ncbi:6709_t:CDS:2, partial [Paraglomus occultum]